MRPDGPSVTLVAGRVVSADDSASLRALVDRLGRRGVAARVLCVAWTGPDRDGIRVEESARLGTAWPLGWSLRGLSPGPAGPGPTLLHVLSADMAAVGLELAERWRVPYLQGVEEFLPAGARLRLSRRWCRGLIATSRELADDLTRAFGIPSAWIQAVPRGLSPRDDRARVRATRDVSVIGAAGALDPGSGLSTFLNAARRVLDAGFDAEFVLFGRGDEENDLRRRADRLRLTDRLTFASEATLGSFRDVLDVYCQPSTIPTVGRNLARAMGSGLPSIASDIEGLRALIAHGRNGLRVPPGDTNALARAILDLLDDRDWADRIGAEARDSILAECDPDREADRLASIYREVSESDRALAGIGSTST